MYHSYVFLYTICEIQKFPGQFIINIIPTIFTQILS